MKKWIAILLAALMAASLAACGSNEQTSSQGVIETEQQDESQTENQPEETETPAENEAGLTETESAENTQSASGSNILIAYFTVPETDGVDTVANASRVATEDGVLGNTEFIATEIQKNLGGDLFAIETVQEYPGTHDPLLEFAYNEKSDNARPELSTHIENLDSYDYIFIGYPNWNADLPMPLYTFFEDFPVVYPDLEPFQAQLGKGLIDDRGDFRLVGDVQPAVTDDVDVRLVEFPVAAPLGALPPVDLADLIAAEGEGQLAVVHGHVFCQGDRQVKAQGQVAVPLLEAVDLLFCLAAPLCQQDLGVLNDGGVQGGEAVEGIGFAQGFHDTLHPLLRCGEQLHEPGQGPGF